MITKCDKIREVNNDNCHNVLLNSHHIVIVEPPCNYRWDVDKPQINKPMFKNLTIQIIKKHILPVDAYEKWRSVILPRGESAMI